MLILITDGAMNRKWKGVYDQGAGILILFGTVHLIRVGDPFTPCLEWDDSCTSDIQSSVAYAKSKNPGVTLITVGVGAANKESVICEKNNCPINVDHLILSADGIEKNVDQVSPYPSNHLGVVRKGFRHSGITGNQSHGTGKSTLFD